MNDEIEFDEMPQDEVESTETPTEEPNKQPIPIRKSILDRPTPPAPPRQPGSVILL